MRITLFLSLIVLINYYDVACVTYNFGEDYNGTLIQCDNGSAWIPVLYSGVGVRGPYVSEKGIRALDNSCATIFPITLVPETNLEIVVFLSAKEDTSGLFVLITDEIGIPIIKYYYSRTVEDYVAGWCKLSFKIKEDGIAYINLFGYSSHNDIVLVDSIQYIPKQSQIESILKTVYDEDKDIADGFDSENNDEVLIDDERYIIDDENNTTEDNLNEEYTDEPEDDENNSGNNDDYENDGQSEESSGEEITTTTEWITEETTTTTQLPIVTDPPKEIRECFSLGPWIITLVVVALVTLFALVSFGFYHLGKTKGLSENPLVYDDIQEPRSAISIPRVRGVVESPIVNVDI